MEEILVLTGVSGVNALGACLLVDVVPFKFHPITCNLHGVHGISTLQLDVKYLPTDFVNTFLQYLAASFNSSL